MSKSEPTLEQIMAENAALKAQLARRSTCSLKVSAKGAVSLYGLGRFPVTLYQSQWARLISNVKEIESFITTHGAELATREKEANGVTE
jgi:hypothetical protein